MKRKGTSLSRKPERGAKESTKAVKWVLLLFGLMGLLTRIISKYKLTELDVTLGRAFSLTVPLLFLYFFIEVLKDGKKVNRGNNNTGNV